MCTMITLTLLASAKWHSLREYRYIASLKTGQDLKNLWEHANR